MTDRQRQALYTLADAAWCFLLSAFVLVGGFVAIGWFIDWLKGRWQ